VKIGSKERLATASLLGVICVIALAVWWTYAELDDASRERREASDIARALTDMRLVTDEYALNHSERARAQWYEVSRRVDNLLAASRLAGQTEQELLAGLRDKRTEGQQIFGDLALTPADDRTDASGAELINRRYEVQSLNRLLIFEQDNLGAAFRLSDLATERGNIAERRLFVVVLSGLALIATIKVGVSWSIRRNVLTPVARLQHVAYQVAGGDWGLEFGRGGDDEVGDLTRNLGRMTQSLRHSFARVERSNQELREGARRLEEVVTHYSPAWLAFVGIGAYRLAYSKPRAGFGLQQDTIAGSRVWVLPNPSGLNAHFKPRDFADCFREFRLAIEDR